MEKEINTQISSSCSKPIKTEKTQKSISYPIKPEFKENKRGNKVNVFTNLLQIRFAPKDFNYVFIYSIQVYPDLEQNPINTKMVFNKAKEFLESVFGIYRIIGNNLFSPKNTNDELKTNVSINVRKNSSIHSSEIQSKSSGSESTELNKKEYSIIIKKTNRHVNLNEYRVFDSSHEADLSTVDFKNKYEYFLKMKMFLEKILKSCLYSNDKIIKFQNGSFFDRTQQNLFDERIVSKLQYIYIYINYL